MKFRIIVFIIIFLSCSESKLLVEHETWKEKRMNALFADDGYLNLAGLYSIDSGYYTMGSDETNDLKLPDIFPKNFATIYVTDSIISFDYYGEVIYKDSIKTFGNPSQLKFIIKMNIFHGNHLYGLFIWIQVLRL